MRIRINDSVTLDIENQEIVLHRHQGYSYGIEFHTCQNAVRLTDWILHIMAKSWCTSDHIHGLVGGFKALAQMIAESNGRSTGDLRYLFCQAPGLPDVNWSELVEWIRQEDQPRRPKFKPSGYVYVLSIEDSPWYKIGQSIDVTQRVSALNGGLPVPAKIICTVPSDDHKRLERQLHEKYSDKRNQGEWFRLDEDDLNSIIELAGCGVCFADEDNNTELLF